MATVHVKLIGDIMRFYKEPHRYYHSADHIQNIFKYAEDHFFELTPAQELAILFHDIIYVPGSKTNEENSVQLMKIMAREFPEQYLTDAASIILDTRTHLTCSIPESALVLDLDLAEIGLDWQIFSRNTHNIRQEFIYASDREFAEGRVTFWKQMLTRDFIYKTPCFRQYEKAARENIQREIDFYSMATR